MKVQEQLNSAQNNYKGIIKQYVISLWFEKNVSQSWMGCWKSEHASCGRHMAGGLRRILPSIVQKLGLIAVFRQLSTAKIKQL